MKIRETLKEVLYGALPIVGIITVLQLTIARMPWSTYADFLGGTLLLVIGLVLFLTGVSFGFIPIGESLGSALVKSRKMSIVLVLGFAIGFAVTLPEPDVLVLATQASELTSVMPKATLLVVIALGVGLFVSLSLLRIFLNLHIKYPLMVGYGVAFILLYFCPPEMASIAFDSGGVTTGSLTVPFIMSLGMGVSSVIAKDKDSENSFGILALASLGPVLTILVMGVVSR